jgi:hypothetical protein
MRPPRVTLLFGSHGVIHPTRAQRSPCDADMVEKLKALAVPESAAQALDGVVPDESTGHRPLSETVELPLIQDQDVIQAFSPHTQEKTFTDRICAPRPKVGYVLPFP